MSATVHTHIRESKTRDDARVPGPWLVGGPGRCGKTRLVLALWENDGPVAGFPLEGLFTLYFKRRFPFFRARRGVVLEEYLSRPRYVDAGRRRTERPARYYTSSLEGLKAALPADIGHPMALLDWALSRFASENGRRTWAAFDLHPEFLYEAFRRHIPGLKLAVMVRDAREAVCATLFWRSYPERGDDAARRFKHRLILWCLGVQTARLLARRWPDDVFVFDFNALVAGNEAECRRVAARFGVGVDEIRAAFDFVPEFDFDPGTGFLGPDGRRARLLSGRELAEVELLAAPYLDGAYRPGPTPDDASPRRGFVVFARAVLALGRVSPGLARVLADLAYYPRRHIGRRMNDVRRLARDAWVGFRCYRDGALPGSQMSRGAHPFFVISGAHGVGKTTALAACRDLFEARRVPIAPFHHIVDGVPAKPARSGEGESRRLLRLLWRVLVPTPLKLALVSGFDEIRYMRGVNRVLRRAAREGRIAIGDRYVYDRLVELRLHSRPAVQRAAVRLVCSLMRRPTLTILLNDDPQAIRGRKQELTVDQIGRFHDDIVALFTRLEVPFVEVRVEGRGPQAVAAEITGRILDAAGRDDPPPGSPDT